MVQEAVMDQDTSGLVPILLDIHHGVHLPQHHFLQAMYAQMVPNFYIGLMLS